MQYYLVEPEKLKLYCAKIFEGEGVPPDSALEVAEMLVSADIRGVRSHGVARVKPYSARMRDGGADCFAEVSVDRETPVTAVLDANASLGGVASAKAVQMAREKAKASGIGLVAVRRSNHFGMAGHWALKLAGDDMIGFCGSNTYGTMVPPGAKKPGIGNNPFSFAYSGGKYRDICVDMATSVVAAGKALDLTLQGKPVPEGWFLDKDGNPTTDYYKRGMMLPFAGHKGYGIAFIVETLSTFLSGGVLTPAMNPQTNNALPELASHSFGAVRIDAFRDLAGFKADVDTYIDFLKSLPVADESVTVKYPGEIELNAKKKTLSEGISLSETLVDELAGIGQGVGLSEQESAFLRARVQE